MMTPRVEFDLAKIGHNVRTLQKLYNKKGIQLMGVTKVVCGNPAIVKILEKNGIRFLADSQIKNIKRMKKARIKATYVLLRSPSLSQVKDVIKYVDISHNTEYVVIKKLSETALKEKTRHKIILMLELGDLREGIMPDDIIDFTKKILELKGIRLVGVGTNLACFGGISPDENNMNELSELVTKLESKCNIELEYISGGSSANYLWAKSTKKNNRINFLRMGESIFLGCEPLHRAIIPDLYTDSFTLVAEIIESKTKPSKPYGTVCQNSFGEIKNFKNKGLMNRIIAGIGEQDVLVSGLSPRKNIEILGSSSDHLIIDKKEVEMEVGHEVSFDMNYSALLSAMTSPYVKKMNLTK